MTKPWYESKTVWAGILEILIAVCLLVADFLTVKNFTAPAFVLLGVGVLTIVLRFVTDTPIVL